jgi:hypothetical protein
MVGNPLLLGTLIMQPLTAPVSALCSGHRSATNRGSAHFVSPGENSVLNLQLLRFPHMRKSNTDPTSNFVIESANDAPPVAIAP